MTQTAIIVLSDPAHGGEEALGRCFNALAMAYDLKKRGRPVEVFFQGAGTRWAGTLQDPKHPVHSLFKAVEDTVRGASCACADVFGAREGVEKSGMRLVQGNPVPGTSGLPSVAGLVADGYAVLTF